MYKYSITVLYILENKLSYGSQVYITIENGLNQQNNIHIASQHKVFKLYNPKLLARYTHSQLFYHSYSYFIVLSQSSLTKIYPLKYISIATHIYMHVCAQVCTCMHIQLAISVHSTYTYIHTYIHTCIHNYVCTAYIHTYYTHACMSYSYLCHTRNVYSYSNLRNVNIIQSCMHTMNTIVNNDSQLKQLCTQLPK